MYNNKIIVGPCPFCIELHPYQSGGFDIKVDLLGFSLTIILSPPLWHCMASSISGITRSFLAVGDVGVLCILGQIDKLQIEIVISHPSELHLVSIVGLLSRSSTGFANGLFLLFLTNLLSKMDSGVISQKGSICPWDVRMQKNVCEVYHFSTIISIYYVRQKAVVP